MDVGYVEEYFVFIGICGVEFWVGVVVVCRVSDLVVFGVGDGIV